MAFLRLRRTRAAAAATLVALTLAVSGCGSSGDVAKLPHYARIPDGGTLGPAKGSVTQLDGSTWSYADPGKGKLTLLYFGYTSCPDICPTTMADVAFALQRVDASVRDKIWVQFVTTDPQRDTPAQIKQWLGGFDDSFHGGRSDEDQMIADAQSYGIAIEKPAATTGNYQVTHGAMLLVLNDKGQEVGYFDELAGHDAYQTGLPVLVKKYA